MKSCITCDKINPYENLAICDECHDTYDTEELKEMMAIYYQRLYDKQEVKNEISGINITSDQW